MKRALLPICLLVVAACGETPSGFEDTTLPYAGEVVSYEIGDAAGFGEDSLPGIVLGPPQGAGTQKGSLDVVSLGVGGEIVLSFGDRVIIDGEGPDFIVFENAFWAGGNSTKVFAELGEVAVSMDGETWTTFPCETTPSEAGSWPGCAGWRPVMEFDPEAIVPPDPEVTGGDPFDLAEIGLEEARFVRIRDLSDAPNSPNMSGFDLDAIGLVHFHR